MRAGREGVPLPPCPAGTFSNSLTSAALTSPVRSYGSSSQSQNKGDSARTHLPWMKGGAPKLQRESLREIQQDPEDRAHCQAQAAPPPPQHALPQGSAYLPFRPPLLRYARFV